MASKKLKFGIQNGLNVARAGYTEDQILTACQLADRTGYDSIFYMDHTNVPQWKNATVLDPWVMLSAIASVTQNVELGTCVTDAIRRHPSNIALAAITLDRVSKGRAILGIGAGEAQNLKEFCIPFEKPVSKWAEQIEVIKTLYHSDPDNTVDYEGKYYKLEKACLQAAPIRKPHPPTYMASGGKRTLDLTGKLGEGWLPIGYTPELFEDHRKQIEVSMDKYGRSQEDKDNFEGSQETGGAIFKVNIDRSHPINFGYLNSTIPIFRNTNLYLKADKQSYNNPIQYTPDPLLSGYISEENLQLVKRSVPFKISRMGHGRVIVLTDNTNFRAFWYGTNRILTNAIYLSFIM